MNLPLRNISNKRSIGLTFASSNLDSLPIFQFNRNLRYFSKTIMSLQQQRNAELAENLSSIKTRLAEATQGLPNACRLVAVSKTKPASDIMTLYELGHRHFGENVQELIQKAEELPKDIQWHFIGSLQSNKCKMLGAIPNLFVVETIDSFSKAKAMNKACKDRTEKMNVFLQINTSAKSGMSPESCVNEAVAIVKECDRLSVKGIMTIGSIEHSNQEDENPDFKTLLDCRQRILEATLNLGITELEVSMGMSDDFELAARMGSTNVRVGSRIFGARNYNK